MISDLSAEPVARLCDGQQTRAAVVVAHPDDETVGAGSRLTQFRDSLFVYTTDGAPRNPRDSRAAGFRGREEYAAARRTELESALATANIEARQIRVLPFADQDASRHMVEITHTLVTLLEQFRPELILTHPYEGGHPDHDATAFAVNATCELLRRRAGDAPPIVEMTSYHNGPQGIRTGEFLPGSSDATIMTIELTHEECRFKQSLIDQYRTQRETLRWFPVGVERFRIAPAYDFTKGAHEGRLFYEQFDWGMSRTQWEELARGTLKRLGLADPL